MYQNKNILDNEVTSLFPITSYVMLSFILFLTSFKNPYTHNFDFRKDREYGIFSERFFNTINSVYKKWPLPSDGQSTYLNSFLKKLYYDDTKKGDVTFNLVDRPFSYLSLPYPNFLLTKEIFDIDDKETHLLKYPKNFPKLKERNMLRLEIPFKTEVLFYLTRFYYNYYSKKYENRIINYTVERRFAKTDRAKLHLNIGLTDEIIDKISANIKTFFEKGMSNDEILSFVRGDSYREKRIENLNEVEEFLIKSIMVRRPPHLKVNTFQNRTDGIYLLHNGVARFRELLYSEILRFPELAEKNIMDYVKFHNRYIELSYSGKKKRLKFNQVVDFSNKPYLLSKKFIQLIDDIYGKYELHHFVKYAQIYTRLFNKFGDKMVYFLLGVELPQYTGFNYKRFKKRYENLKVDGRIYSNYFTFDGFEFLFYDKLRSYYTDKKPDNRKFLKLCKVLYENKIYSAEKRASLVDRFCYHP